MTEPRNKAVLVDLDGTLIDTAPDIVEAVSRMLRQFDAAALPFETVSGFIGKGVPNLVRRTLEATGLDQRIDFAHALHAFNHHYAQTNGRIGRVFPGAAPGLESLRRHGYRLACVTNKPEALAAPLLLMTGLAGYLDVLVAGDSPAGMKPEPGPLWHACTLLDVEPAHSTLVGDSPVDVAAARAAGVPVLIVRYGYAGPTGAAMLDCDGFVDSLEEVAGVIEGRRGVNALG